MKRFTALALFLLLTLAVLVSCTPQTTTDPLNSDQIGLENSDNASQNTPGRWTE